METLEITKFGGPLTRRHIGNIDSGYAKFATSHGYDPFSRPGNLTWMEQPTSIFTQASVAGAIAAMEQHVENPFAYEYIITNDGKLRKFNIANDSPSVVGALTTAPTATNGADIVFYGTTEKVFYGDDNGIQKVNIDGSSPSVIGNSSVTSNVPRPMAVFAGKIYFGNNNNIGEIDTTELVTTGTKLSPGLPTGLCVRDIDVTPDGNYLQITAMRYNPTGGYITPTTAVNAGVESYKYYWNGIDQAATASESYRGVGLTANTAFGGVNYSIGFESTGTALLKSTTKELSLPQNTAPFASGTFSFANMLGMAMVEYESSSQLTKGSLYAYGRYDNEVPTGLYRLLRLSAPTRSNVFTLQGADNVSNIYLQSSVITSNNVTRQGKVYFSTTEASVVDTDNYINHLWSFSTAPVGLGSAIGGVYETQSQLFSKKVKATQVRLYTEPLAANTAFTLDVVNSASSVLTTSSYVTGSNVTVGDDVIRWNPNITSQSIGMRITNNGSANWVGTKMEVDWAEAGT